MTGDYVLRIVDPLLDELMTAFPAVSLVGPRAAGKTTTAVRRAATVLRLDQPAIRQTLAAAPDEVLTGLREPILLDEWQEVPDVLGAVKRSVDADSRPGRFILTGSVRAELEGRTWPGTGRILQVPLFGMSERERRGQAAREPLIDRIAAAGSGALTAPQDPLTIRDYLDLMLTGTFPELAVGTARQARQRWFAGYVQQAITRDIPAVAPQRNPELLRRYLSALALNTAGIVTDTTLNTAAGIDRKTAQGYEGLFQSTFLLDVVPPWFSSRLKRLLKTPKRYLIDPALVAAILGLNHDAILFGPDMLGRLLDTFVTSQVRAELAASDHQPRLHHLRDEGGRHEVDLIVEMANGRIIAIEVKAANTVTDSDARHLAWLRDEIGDAFICGVVLHTGPYVFPLGDRLAAAPISSLWN